MRRGRARFGGKRRARTPPTEGKSDQDELLTDGGPLRVVIAGANVVEQKLLKARSRRSSSSGPIRLSGGSTSVWTRGMTTPTVARWRPSRAIRRGAVGSAPRPIRRYRTSLSSAEIEPTLVPGPALRLNKAALDCRPGLSPGATPRNPVNPAKASAVRGADRSVDRREALKVGAGRSPGVKRKGYGMYDAAIIGGGLAGVATAARLQARGLATIVLEAHGQPGGCAGYFRRRGFSFDVGATTLVDFGPGGVGGELLERIGMMPIEGEELAGYVAWLPDRTVTLYRDRASWSRERLKALGDTPAHRSLWRLLDRLADVFWRASRGGVKLPIRGPADAIHAARAVGLRDLPLIRYVRWTLADAIRAHGLESDRALVGLLAMLVEDTVHASVAEAPLINSALGITIRGAGLTRARGGMRGFWQGLIAHYRRLGGELRVGCPVKRVEKQEDSYLITARRGVVAAHQVIAAIPAPSRLGSGRNRSRRPWRPTSAAIPPRQAGRWSSSSACPRTRLPGRRSVTINSSRATTVHWATATTCSSPSPPLATPTAPRVAAVP